AALGRQLVSRDCPRRLPGRGWHRRLPAALPGALAPRRHPLRWGLPARLARRGEPRLSRRAAAALPAGAARRRRVGGPARRALPGALPDQLLPLRPVPRVALPGARPRRVPERALGPLAPRGRPGSARRDIARAGRAAGAAARRRAGPRADPALVACPPDRPRRGAWPPAPGAPGGGDPAGAGPLRCLRLHRRRRPPALAASRGVLGPALGAAVGRPGRRRAV